MSCLPDRRDYDQHLPFEHAIGKIPHGEQGVSTQFDPETKLLLARVDLAHQPQPKPNSGRPHEAWSAKHFLKDVGLESGDIGYPLLIDPALTVSATYGVAMQMKIHVELSNRPATFIIDREGMIRYERREKTFSDRPKPDELLHELSK